MRQNGNNFFAYIRGLMIRAGCERGSAFLFLVIENLVEVHY